MSKSASSKSPRGAPGSPNGDRSSEATEPPAWQADRMSRREFEFYLSKLDVLEYGGDHDRWLELMMAAHAATGGAGREEFVRWSTCDPEYADHGAEIRTRWNSLRTDGGSTEATFYTHLSDQHGAVPRTPAEWDCADEEEPSAGDFTVWPRPQIMTTNRHAHQIADQIVEAVVAAKPPAADLPMGLRTRPRRPRPAGRGGTAGPVARRIHCRGRRRG